MTDTAIQSYWSKEERAQLEQHITTQLRHLIGDALLMVIVQPEIVFLENPDLKGLWGSTRDFSIWIRETYFGQPFAASKGALFSYLRYVEVAIHEAAHVVALGQGHGAPFRAAEKQLRRKATLSGIWPVREIPAEIGPLFREPLENKSLRDWILRQSTEQE